MQELQAMAALHMAAVMGTLVMVLVMAAAGMAAAMVPVHMVAVMVVVTAVTARMADPHLVDQWVAPCMVQVVMVVGTAAVTEVAMAAATVVMVLEP